MTRNKSLLLAGGALLTIAACGAAYGQDTSLGAAMGQTSQNSNFARDRNVSVRERPHPGYEALGVRQGGFMVYPKVGATLEYNDNIFATTSGTQVSDTIARINPGVDVQSTWSRHALELYAQGTINQYFRYSSQNTNDYSVGARGRLDVLRNEQINGGVDWSRLTEPRTSAPAQNALYPIQYNLGTAYLAGFNEFNRLRVSGRVDFQHYDYLNRAGNPDEDDRDRDVTIGTVRADYAISPDTALFLEVAGNDRNYRLASSPIVNGAPVFPTFVNRDSTGSEVLAGANFDLTALVRGEIGVGYLTQSYKDPRFNDISGLGVRTQVEWFPTQLVTVTFSGTRTLEDAGIPGASGYLSTNIGAVADYELLRNVIISANAGYGNDNYRGVDRNDRRYLAGINGTYLLNRSLGVTVGYSYFKQNSRGAAGTGDFNVNKIAATLTLQY